MQPEALSSALFSALSAYGLDVKRYTPGLVATFLTRFPTPERWDTSEARAGLISTFAIGETTFLRHPEHFYALRALVPGLIQERAGRPLRVWSAGCATGEEVYSLAATLRSAAPYPFEVIGWDINPDAIARAEFGEYRPWSLRDVDEEATRDWLLPAPSGVRIDDSLRPFVRFQVGNLVSDPYPPELDVVFCRNVLLYFKPEAARQVYERIAMALAPGGCLFIGHYDPRPTPDIGLSEERNGDVFYYRKRRAEVSFATATHVRLGERLTLPPRAVSLRPPAVENTEARLDLARWLVNQRRHSDALKLLREASLKCALRPDYQVLTALAAEDAGDVKLMLDAARKACFLAPDHAGPNYFLSVAFVRNGELRRASVHRRIAANALRNVTDSHQVLTYSEGLTAGQLKRLLGALAR